MRCLALVRTRVESDLVMPDGDQGDATTDGHIALPILAFAEGAEN